MIPIWLQLVTAVSAGLVSALLGIALVPFLQKLRFYPPEAPKPEDAKEEELSREERRPILGGVLLLAGAVFALALGTALFLQFGSADRTSSAFSRQVGIMQGAGICVGLLAAMGLIMDIMTSRGKYKPDYWDWVVPGIMWVSVAGAMEFGYVVESRADLFWTVALTVLAVPLLGMRTGLERSADGTTLVVNAVELLFLTMILLRRSMTLPALLTLAAAGACLGTTVWCMHPAKCRIGRTGCYVLAGLVPILCICTRCWRELALFTAVYALQQLYRLRKRENKYLTEGMADAGIEPLPRIAILAGIAAFCGAMALLLK